MTRKFCGNYRGIDVYKCGELNNDNFLGHIYMLEKAPDALAESCEALYFTGEALSVPEVGQNGFGNRLFPGHFLSDGLRRLFFNSYCGRSDALSAIRAEGHSFRDLLI